MTDGTYDPTLRRPESGSAITDLPEGLEVGEYRVLRKIGEGGMGAVYAAIHPVIGKRVAIKVLAPHIAKHPELVRRFIDEARAVNKIGHPNIVDIFSFGWLADQRHYFAMEYLEGLSLADRMKAGTIEIVEARRLLGQICGALEAAHQAGIIHRDLKPDNIWVAAPKHGESFAKLLDFGIAKLMGDGESAPRTVTGAIMGTPAYMAPEQCRGVGVEPRTDVYALGVILYEMFAGQTPFQGSFVELITQHLSVVPEPPSSHRPIPAALERLILACLDKDPVKRPASAAALRRELEAVLGGAPSSSAASPGPAAAAPAPEAASGGLAGISAGGSTPAAETGLALDTLAPPPGKTSPGATLVPARARLPRLWLGGAVVTILGVVLVAVLARRAETPDANARIGGDTSGVAAPAAAAPAAFGHVRVQAENVNNARFFIDDRLVASGAREADLPSVVPDRPHVLRIEADGLSPAERRFTVAPGGIVEIRMALGAAPALTSKRTPPPPPSPPHSVTGAPAALVNPARPRTPEVRPPGAKPTRHRDGLVGDDIFDK